MVCVGAGSSGGPKTGDFTMGHAISAAAMPAFIQTPGFIRTGDGAALFYRDWGAGKPIVFVASWALPSESWSYQMMALVEQGFRCIAYDRRGHGRSSDPGRGYDFDTLADDLAAVLDALDLHDVTLVGFSMGGAEIVRYVTRHGTARIGRLVSIAPTTPLVMRRPDNPQGFDEAVLEDLHRAFEQDFPQWVEENARPFVLPETSQATLEWVKGMALQTSLKAVIDCHRMLVREDFREELRAIDLPVLVIQGDADISSPMNLAGRPTAELIPGAWLEIYQGAPHGLFITHRERLNRDLAKFAAE
jgi:non-heme chloroperoxidase